MKTDPRNLEQLTAYLDGELAPAQRADVERLLQQDPDARALLDDLRKTVQLIAGLPRINAPSQLASAVARRLDSAGLHRASLAPQRRLPRWTRPVAIAAGLALAALTLWSYRASFTATPATLNESIVLADKDAIAKKPPIVEDAGRKSSDLSEEKLADASTPAARTETLTPAERAAPAMTGRFRGSSESLASSTRDAPASTVAIPPNALARDDAPVELRLQANALTNRALLEAPAAAWGNQLIIESDADTNARLIACIDKYVGDNRIPDAKSADLPEPIPPTQNFYFRDDAARPTDSAGEQSLDDRKTGDAISSQTIYLNLAPNQAADLFENLQSTVADKPSGINWIANGRSLSRNENLPAQLVDACGKRQAEAARLLRSGDITDPGGANWAGAEVDLAQSDAIQSEAQARQRPAERNAGDESSAESLIESKPESESESESGNGFPHESDEEQSKADSDDSDKPDNPRQSPAGIGGTSGADAGRDSGEQFKASTRPTSRPTGPHPGLARGRRLFGGGDSSAALPTASARSPVDSITIALNFRSIQPSRLKVPTTPSVGAAAPASQPAASRPAARGPPGG